jgi:hypothetical protein
MVLKSKAPFAIMGIGGSGLLGSVIYIITTDASGVGGWLALGVSFTIFSAGCLCGEYLDCKRSLPPPKTIAHEAPAKTAEEIIEYAATPSPSPKTIPSLPEPSISIRADGDNDMELTTPKHF